MTYARNGSTNVTLTRVPVSSGYAPDGSIYVTTSPYVTGATRVSLPEQIINSSFEDNLTSWGPGGDGTATVGTTTPNSGTKYMILDKGGVGATQEYAFANGSNTFTAQAGKNYTFSAWVRGDTASAAGASFRIGVEWYSPGPSSTGSGFIDSPLTTSWVKVSQTLTAPPATTMCRIYVLHSTTSTTRYCHVDDVSVKLAL